MPRYGETVWHRRRPYSYPFGLMKTPRYLLSAGRAKLRGLLRRPGANAKDYYRLQYGRCLADEIALPLTEAWSGAPGSELAAAIGEKFATSIGRIFLLKAAASLTRRTVAVGYSSTVAESPHVWHVYPEGGIGAICAALAAEVQDAIQTRTPVEAIHVEDNRVVGVRANGEDIPASAVVSTAPVHVLPKLVRGTDRLAHLAHFRYRAMVFVNIRLDGPSGLPDVVTWTPGEEFPFFRLSDIGLGLPWLVPAGKTQVTCDIGCTVGDSIWTADEGELGRRCLAALELIVPGIQRGYLGCRVMRTPLAYPIFKSEYEEQRQRFENGSGIDGLLSVGRNGAFAHILMEDVYWRTRRQCQTLLV